MASDDDGPPGARPDPTLLSATHRDHWAAFYDSFDRLVHETSSRSADLLRQAMVLPAIADRELAQAQAEAARQVTEEQSRRRAILAVLQADLEGSRRRTELLASSVASLASLAGDVLADVARLSNRVAAALSDLETEPAAAPVAMSAPDPLVNRETAGSRGWAWESDSAARQPSATHEGDETRVVAEESPASTTGAGRSDGVRTVELIVRGARPTSALSLQRYLATLNHVANAEVRDYAADVLRIEVQVERPLTATDLTTWDTGAGLEIISLGDDIVEIRLADPLRSPKLLPPRERSSA